MKHYGWTYVAGGGRNIPVGLYHSSKKGHLIIYVGKKITTIDFSVLDTKEYTFFIDNELCRIKLERRGDEMYYFFEIDKKADTPMNRARWAMERKFLKMLLGGLAVFILIIVGTFFFIDGFRNPTPASAEKLLNAKGVETVARVTVDRGEPKPDITYHFIAQNQDYSSKPSLQSQPLVLLKNGMPLESGDEFVVLYIPSNPSVSRIDFDRPSERQISIYQKRAAQKHLSVNPGEAPQIADCMVKTAYEMEGIAGLAKFYFQNTPPSENPAHNKNSFFRLVRSLPFQKKIKEDCW
ncbi:MAG: hypothetical protein AAFZ15_01905 [Bacteroidota bacterium]